MATVTINGVEIAVPEGTLILDAARMAGFYIPTFCYQVDLIGIGACRMCLVQVEGQKKLIASCVTPVLDGMIIYTETDAVNQARADMLEFLLANHGLDCPVCDKGGECELQDMVYRYGPHKGRYAEQKYRWHDKDYIISPVIIKNSNRCVQCMKCVRVCKEVVGRNVLDGLYRGEKQEETTFFRGMLDCDQDGNCIEVCPVGCFMRLPFRYKARPWDLHGADTICPYCATGCRMVIEERDGLVIRSRAKLGVGLNSETLCARGRFGYDVVNHPDRLTTPLLKRGGKLVAVSWDEALSEIRRHFKAADPRKMGGLASARLTNEELYLFQKLFRSTFGSPNLDSSTRWDPLAVQGFAAAAGMAEGGVSVFDCMAADVVLIIGSHLSDENPVTDYMVRRMARENGTTVLIASTRAMKLDSSARRFVRHMPGTEKEVLEALGLVVGRLHRATPSGDAEQADFKSRSMENLLGAAELTPEAIDALAEILVDAKRIGIMVGSEFIKFPRGAGGLASLVDLLKNIGKTVTIVPILDRCNQRGAWEMGVHPEFGPAYEALKTVGIGFEAMLEAAGAGKLESFYIIGEDPVSTHRDQRFTAEALSKVKFLLVQDIFLTETASMAHCVLPGACFAEKQGTFTNQEGRVQSIERLMKPPGHARSDLAVIVSVARLFDPAFASEARGWSAVFSGIRENLDMYRNVSLAFNNNRNEDNNLDNRSALVKGSGVTLSQPPGDLEAPRHEDDRDRFILTTGNHLFHSGRFSRRSKLLNKLLAKPVVEISEADAERLALAEGDRVKVRNSRFEAVLTLRIARGSKSKVAFIAENFEDVPVFRFFDRAAFVASVSISPV